MFIIMASIKPIFNYHRASQLTSAAYHNSDIKLEGILELAKTFVSWITMNFRLIHQAKRHLHWLSLPTDKVETDANTNTAPDITQIQQCPNCRKDLLEILACLFWEVVKECVEQHSKGKVSIVLSILFRCRRQRNPNYPIFPNPKNFLHRNQ